MQNKYWNKEVQAIIKDNKHLNSDVIYLQNILCKINERLKYRITQHTETTESAKKLLKSKNFTTVSRESVDKLNELALIYGEFLQEKDYLLKSAGEQLSKAVGDLASLAKENEDLMLYIENIIKENNDVFGNESKHKEKILLKESEQCHENISVLNQHEEKSYTTLRLQENYIEDADRTIIELQSDIANLQERQTALTIENAYLKEIVKNTIPVEDHKKAVGECSKMFVKLKHAYYEDAGIMKAKIEDAREKSVLLNNKLFFSAGSIKGLRSQSVGFKKDLRKNIMHQRRQHNVLKELKQIRHALKMKITNLSKVCSELVKDRKNMIMKEQDHKIEIRNLRVALKEQTSIVGGFSIKLKEERLECEKKFAVLEGQKNAAILAWHRCSKAHLTLDQSTDNSKRPKQY